jgi:hypothetical protein
MMRINWHISVHKRLRMRQLLVWVQVAGVADRAVVIHARPVVRISAGIRIKETLRAIIGTDEIKTGTGIGDQVTREMRIKEIVEDVFVLKAGT